MAALIRAALLLAAALAGGQAFAAGQHDHDRAGAPPSSDAAMTGRTAAPDNAGSATPASTGPCTDPAEAPTLRCARSPSPAFAPDGRLWLAWYGGGHVYVQHSDDGGRRFSTPQAINPEPETVDDQGEDRPRIAVGPGGELYVLWTRKLNKPYTGHIRFSRSLDGGKRFSPPVNVNDDGAEIAHRFANFLVTPGGELFVAWVDKRPLEAAKAADQPYRGAALYYAVSRDRGASFEPNRKLADHSCECCRLALAPDERGLPLLLYRHVFEGEIRDHALIGFDALDQPRAPRRVSEDAWHIEGCPHHGPALASQGALRHLAWFTAGAARQGLFYARADANGIGEPVGFGEPGAERPAVAALGDMVVLAWKTLARDRTEIRLQRSTDGGRSWGAAETAAGTDGGSDQPLLVNDGRRLYLSWQTVDEGYRLLPLTAAGERAR